MAAGEGGGGEGKAEARYASLPACVRAPINEKGGPVVGRDAAQPSSARVAGARSSGRFSSVLSVRVRRAGAADAHRHRQRRCRTRLGRAPLKLRVCVPLKRIVRGARCGRGGGGAGTSARERDGARRGGGREQGTSRDFVDAGGSNYRFFREKIWSANRFLGFRLGAWQTFPFRSHVQVCFRQRLSGKSRPESVG